MNYIILDLEWDNTYCHKKNGFANQIVQIGAVKLNADFEVIDRFEVIVKTESTKKLTKRFTELTGITTDAMRAGISFSEAVERYNEWIGEDTVSITWSNSDLYVIAENARLFSGGKTLKFERYADLQKYVQSLMKREGENAKNQVSLAFAAECLGISIEEFALHSAVDDSLLTAAVLKKTYNSEAFAKYVVDADNPEFFARISFKNYYIANINDKHIDRAALKFNCDICGEAATECKKWRYHNHWFFNEFECVSCGNRFTGRVSFKKTYSSVKVAKRITRKQVEKNAAAL